MYGPSETTATQGGPSALARFIGLLQRASVGIIIVGVLLVVVESLVPTAFAPTRLIGGFIGKIEEMEILVKGRAAAWLAALLADANARAQIEIDTNRQEQETLSQALGLKALTAVLADGQCYAGSLFRIWGGRDARDIAEKLETQCGVGDMERDSILQRQADTGRRGGAIQSRTNNVPDAPRTRMWPAQQQVADGPPLNRGENNAIARLEASLSEAFVAKAKANRLPGNNGMRLYLEALRVGAGEPPPPDMTAPVVVPHAGPPPQKPAGQYVPQPVHGFFGQP
jgi:hypothetical protein